MDSITMLRSMMLIRAFEAALLRHPSHGFQLLSSGQEAVAVGVCAAMTTEDQLLTSGRSIGLALARGLDAGRVFAELLGKSSGPCKGKGGRGHIAEPSRGFFGAHAVVGGNLTIATGVALAFQSLGHAGAVVCVFGDGAGGGGSLQRNAQYSRALEAADSLHMRQQSVFRLNSAHGGVDARTTVGHRKPFKVPGATVDSMDVLAVRAAAEAFLERTRVGNGPSFLECVSFRFSSHSTASRETRTKEEMDNALTRCPIQFLAARLTAEGLLTPNTQLELDREVVSMVAEAYRFADASPFPDALEALCDVV